MTVVTGKFVLKCRTTNIATLFDISLFYVYKFYLICFPQVQHRTATPRVGVASSTILKNIEGFGGEQLPLTQNHFYTQNRVQKWSFFIYCCPVKVFPPHKSNRSGCNLLIIKGKHNIE